MGEFEISPELMAAAWNHPDLPGMLQAKADEVADRARSLAKAEGVEMEVTTVAGVRPKGRHFVNVISDNADQEFGSSKSARYRILGRSGK